MDDEPKVNDRAKDAPEPVCFFSPPIELMEELLHTFFGKMDVDLRAADGKLAFACLQNRVAYLGVTYNEVHSKLLEGLDLMQTSMAYPSSPLFNNNYAQAIGVVTHTPTPKPKPGPKAKTETKKGKQMRLGSRSPSRKPRRLRSLRLKK